LSTDEIFCTSDRIENHGVAAIRVEIKPELLESSHGERVLFRIIHEIVDENRDAPFAAS